MTDIVHWLRHEVHMIFLQGEPNRLHEAADEIERLRKVLGTIARFSEEWGAFAEEALQQKESE